MTTQSSHRHERAGPIPAALQKGSRNDFLQLLRSQGAQLSLSYYRYDGEAGEVRQMQHVFLRCRREDWIKSFGEINAAPLGRDPKSGSLVYAWQHECLDGPVTCIGYFFEHPTGVSWVVVVRVCFS